MRAIYFTKTCACLLMRKDTSCVFMLSVLAPCEQRHMKKSEACLVCWTVRHLFIVHAEGKGGAGESGFFAAVVMVTAHSWL